MAGVEIRRTRYDDPAAVRLNELVQQEYAERYGDGDLTPMAAGHFDPPQGLYLVAFDAGGEPVASGGWRAQDANPEGHEDGDAELKRMFVIRRARRQGLARRILAELETAAAAAGRTRMVLETGSRQPEAIALYESCGYTPVRKFGYYRHEELSVCLGKRLAGA